jgi:hypothetical protein
MQPDESPSEYLARMTERMERVDPGQVTYTGSNLGNAVFDPRNRQWILDTPVRDDSAAAQVRREENLKLISDFIRTGVPQNLKVYEKDGTVWVAISSTIVLVIEESRICLNSQYLYLEAIIRKLAKDEGKKFTVLKRLPSTQGTRAVVYYVFKNRQDVDDKDILRSILIRRLHGGHDWICDNGCCCEICCECDSDYCGDCDSDPCRCDWDDED